MLHRAPTSPWKGPIRPAIIPIGRFKAIALKGENLFRRKYDRLGIN